MHSSFSAMTLITMVVWQLRFLNNFLLCNRNREIRQMKRCMKDGNSFAFLCHDIQELEHSRQADLPRVTVVMPLKGFGEHNLHNWRSQVWEKHVLANIITVSHPYFNKTKISSFLISFSMLWIYCYPTLSNKGRHTALLSFCFLFFWGSSLFFWWVNKFSVKQLQGTHTSKLHRKM